MIKQLINSEGNGHLSHTKLWSNVAYLAATIGFIWKVYKGTDMPEIWFIYLGIVGASAAAHKLIAMKYSGAQEGGK
ncbi:hypothetical protein EDC30_102247 [Paucimonas lemoignei]|uniref:Uncharacterized protein n=1 Tax=Paucimonas lemoignei TaxID=29443 RepID=A0A4R3HZ42_PAULE|nr:hypothetical protein [Paucimonas lemoignei]TCS38508.1 hypothetical protein EDC30_102247 [Paucimonas lemoignei]